MNVFWRLKMDSWHVLLVSMVWSICLVCQPALAQDKAATAEIFLDSTMRQALPQAPHVSDTGQRRRPAGSPSASLPFHLNVLRYLSKKRGKIPVYSGMDGKIQLEFGVFGYLGVKFQF